MTIIPDAECFQKCSGDIMEMTVMEQTVSFFYSAFAGFLTGMMYEFFKSLKNVIFTNRITRDFVDVIFVFLVSVFLFFSFYRICALSFRFYHVLGLFLGVVIFFTSVNRVIYKIFEKILIIFKEIFKILLYPVKLFSIMIAGIFMFMFKIIKIPVKYIKNFIGNIIISIKKISKRTKKV